MWNMKQIFMLEVRSIYMQAMKNHFRPAVGIATDVHGIFASASEYLHCFGLKFSSMKAITR